MLKSLLALVAALGLAVSASATSIPLTAKIDNLQPVPPTTSLAFGTGVFDFDTVLNVLTYSIVTTNALLDAPEVRAQIHGPALPGANGPAIADLALGSTKLGLVTFSLLSACPVVATCAADLLAGKWYVQLDTDAHGTGGEIRGQILKVNEPTTVLLGIVGLIGLGLASRPRLRLSV